MRGSDWQVFIASFMFRLPALCEDQFWSAVGTRKVR